MKIAGVVDTSKESLAPEHGTRATKVSRTAHATMDSIAGEGGADGLVCIWTRVRHQQGEWRPNRYMSDGIE